MTKVAKQRLRRGLLYALLLVIVLAVALLADWPTIQKAFFNPDVAIDMFPEVLTVAAKNTIVYTLLAFALGLILALILALMKRSEIRPYRWIATTYIELFRGLPALVTLSLVAFGLPIALGVSIPGGTLGKGTIGLGIVAGAYMAETIRAGIEAVPRGQMEAARSLGMSKGVATRLIILPQAFRIIIPPLTNEAVILIKDTSLYFVLGTTIVSKELTKFGNDFMNDTFNGTPLIVIALVYLVITLPLTRFVAQLEKRAARAR